MYNMFVTQNAYNGMTNSVTRLVVLDKIYATDNISRKIKTSGTKNWWSERVTQSSNTFHLISVSALGSWGGEYWKEFDENMAGFTWWGREGGKIRIFPDLLLTIKLHSYSLPSYLTLQHCSQVDWGLGMVRIKILSPGENILSWHMLC